MVPRGISRLTPRTASTAPKLFVTSARRTSIPSSLMTPPCGTARSAAGDDAVPALGPVGALLAHELVIERDQAVELVLGEARAFLQLGCQLGEHVLVGARIVEQLGREGLDL